MRILSKARGRKGSFHGPRALIAIGKGLSSPQIFCRREVQICAILHNAGWTQKVETAFITSRLARMANHPPMQNQAMGKACPLRRRQDLGQVAFYPGWVKFPGETQAARQSLTMRIHGNAGKAKCMTANNVGGLTPDAGKGRQVF